MGLGNILKNLVGKEEEPKKYKAPEVDFIEEPGFAGVTHTIPIEVELPKQQYIIKHNGEYIVFNSLQEMPEHLRDEIEHIDEFEEFSHSYNVIVNGERKTYRNLEDMPEEIRKAIQKS
jgi:hypothetical protein